MRSVLAGLRQLVIPWGARPTDPHVVIGGDIPAELTTFYQQFSPDFVVVLAIIYWMNATDYWWSALTESPTYGGGVASFSSGVTRGGVVKETSTQYTAPAAFFGNTDLIGDQIDLYASAVGGGSRQPTFVDIFGTLLVDDLIVLGSVTVGTANERLRKSEDTTTQSAFGTAFQAGSPPVGHSFVTPASGNVEVDVYGALRAEVTTTAARTLFLGYEIRTGGLVGSGTVVAGADADQIRTVYTGTGGTSGAIAFLRASISETHALSPNTTYNVRTMHGCNATTSFDRQILVRRVTTKPGFYRP